jgi:hypothetical protein
MREHELASITEHVNAKVAYEVALGFVIVTDL